MSPPGGCEVAAAVWSAIEFHTGLVFDEFRRAALGPKLRALGPPLDRFQSWAQVMTQKCALRDRIIEAVTVAESYFFRDQPALGYFERVVLPSRWADLGYRRPLKVWSAGCAAGEEAYTFAIMLDRMGWSRAAHVVGTDVSAAALTRARGARYRNWALRGLDDAVRTQYFTKDKNTWVLRDDVARQVTWRQHNLVTDPMGYVPKAQDGFDIIFCKNVLIYMSESAARTVVGRLFEALAPGGILSLAATDPLIEDWVPVEAQWTEAGLLYRRPRADEEVESEMPPPISTATSSHDPPGPMVGDLGQDDTTELERCRTALASHPLDTGLHLWEGRLLAKMGRLEDAVAAFRKTLYLDRSHVDAHRGLGHVLVRLGRAKEAQRAYRNAWGLETVQKDNPQ